MDASQMYVSNSWYKSKIREFGSPKPGQLIVVVFYAEATKVLVTGNVRPFATKVIELKCDNRHGQQISTVAAKAKVVLIELAVKNNTHILRNTGKIVEFIPVYNLSIAS